MGVDCGFDVYPSLIEDLQGLYDVFLDEVIEKYKNELNPSTGEPLIQIIGKPETKNAYIFFNVGEGPILPYRCEYFLRFESKLVKRDNVFPYLEGVYLIARRYFNGFVQFWASGMSPAWIGVPNAKTEEGPVRTDHEHIYKMMREILRLVEEDRERSTQVDSGKEAT
ncbi:hypothetical protein GL218_08250 [Daldinia childiae]|uniref:uncharacterized protein n=1 Tax=Daldinia childiae TaxID=326645 RepID=UPI001444D7A4|nr:uncharacterized protein GL218_08250 [Daldinia childiae]KAF3068463.1 hypothetical protein GL218_08250 [Daldinia childiae]